MLIYAKFHHCRICVTDFKKGSILSLTTHEKSLKDPCWKALSRARLFLIIKNGCWNWKYILPRFGGLFHWQEKQFSYASSIRSQAIEAFWSRLKRLETFLVDRFFYGLDSQKYFKIKKQTSQRVVFVSVPTDFTKRAEWISDDMEQPQGQTLASPPSRVHVVLFQIRGTVGLQKLGIGVERWNAGVEKDILEVNSLLYFEIRICISCLSVVISSVQFNAAVLVFL